MSGESAGRPPRETRPPRPPRMDPLTVSTFRPILPVVLARATGTFADAGLEVDVRAAESSAGQLAALAAGDLDVAHTALDNVVAWSASEPVRVIGVLDLGVAHELVARAPIASLEDLRAAAIGVDAPDNGFVVLMAAILADAGLAAGDYRICAVGGLPARARALAAGEIDACLLSGQALAEALAQGRARLTALRERFPRYPALAAVARAPLAGSRRDALTRYLSALTTAARTPTDAPGATAAVAEVLGVGSERARAWLLGERARMTGVVDGATEAEAVVAEGLRVTGRLAAGAAASPFMELLMDPGPAAMSGRGARDRFPADHSG